MKYTVAITTYYKRFDSWFKPLLIEIKKQRPNAVVIVGINGELNHFDEKYRKKMLAFLAGFPNVYPIFYPRFRSMSRMWNLNTQFSTERTVLHLSDDVTLVEGFFNTYEIVLNHVNDKPCKTFSINGSFSAFSLDEQEMIDVGWFDEHLLGMGWEDGVFIERYKRHKNINFFPFANIDNCKNSAQKGHGGYNERLAKAIKKETKEHKSRLQGQRLDAESKRYSKYNKEIYDKKLPYVENYPFEEYYLRNKHLL